jgi:hypothetical protein
MIYFFKPAKLHLSLQSFINHAVLLIKMEKAKPKKTLAYQLR